MLQRYIPEVEEVDPEFRMTGELTKKDGSNVWEWEEGEDSFVTNHSQELVDTIRNHINEHGLPEEEI